MLWLNTHVLGRPIDIFLLTAVGLFQNSMILIQGLFLLFSLFRSLSWLKVYHAGFHEGPQVRTWSSCGPNCWSSPHLILILHIRPHSPHYPHIPGVFCDCRPPKIHKYAEKLKYQNGCPQKNQRTNFAQSTMCNFLIFLQFSIDPHIPREHEQLTKILGP